ncbi:MAG: hypothetical protein AVDCRST_MAG32-2950, partial [uncultured Nocardioides sp.]
VDPRHRLDPDGPRGRRGRPDAPAAATRRRGRTVLDQSCRAARALRRGGGRPGAVGDLPRGARRLAAGRRPGGHRRDRCVVGDVALRAADPHALAARARPARHGRQGGRLERGSGVVRPRPRRHARRRDGVHLRLPAGSRL